MALEQGLNKGGLDDQREVETLLEEIRERLRSGLV
jgi:hypothetical protein